MDRSGWHLRIWAPRPLQPAAAAISRQRAARDQQLAFARVGGQPGGAFELGARLGVAAQAEQQVATHARQQVVVGQLGLAGQRIHQRQRRFRTCGHGHRHRAVERHHR